MARYNLLLPRMGESVSEATIVKWLKQPGDWVELDDTVLDIATDKVDSEVPSPVSGTLVEQLFKQDEVAQVGDIIAVLETEEVSEGSSDSNTSGQQVDTASSKSEGAPVPELKTSTAENLNASSVPAEDIPFVPSQSPAEEGHESSKNRFYSPLVKNIAFEEGVSMSELDTISGSGLEGRVTKEDILSYVASRKKGNVQHAEHSVPVMKTSSQPLQQQQQQQQQQVAAPSLSGGDEIIEMDRMRKLIAEHMVRSVQTSPHVCSFVEADVTNIVKWRNRIKADFERQEGTKITFTPIFIEAVAKAIRDYPMINIQVSGTQIIKKRDINIGMAAALSTGNLIVPVIRNADRLNLVGMTKTVNDLAERAKGGKLKPDETQGGTFTVTNVGSFGSIMGTPIINQPQVAILALGAIVKKPAVLETADGDVIAIRHKMILSLSYDHRVVDGALGGMFLKRVSEYLESWDPKRTI